MMGEVLLPGAVHRETEFLGGLTGACGPNAAAMAESWADQRRIGTLDVYRRMRAAGRCDANGVSTLAALADDARDAGYTVDLLPYTEPLDAGTWRAFFQRHVGQRAVVMETANGQALVDALSGAGENARNLQYHFIVLFGRHDGGFSPRAGRDLPPGWWCGDGANFVVGDALQFYPETVLAESRPCGALAIWPRALGGAGVGGGDTVTGVPNGWQDDGTTLVAPNGVPVVRGFRTWVLTHVWDADDWPLAPESGANPVEPGNPAIGVGTRQDFRMTSLGWTRQRDVYRIWAGQDLAALRQQAAAASTAAASAQAERDAARTQVAALEAEVARLRQAGATAEGTAVAALRSLKAALAALDTAPVP